MRLVLKIKIMVKSHIVIERNINGKTKNLNKIYIQIINFLKNFCVKHEIQVSFIVLNVL